MLAYQAHVAQLCANTNIKPRQQESSLFSHYDPSCSPFLSHQCRIQKNDGKNNNEDMQLVR
jgi:hypothetical protein